MSDQCFEGIDVLARQLGFTCKEAAPIVTLRNPFELVNWTLPVLELLVVTGAGFALWWAIHRMRRDGDPVNLVLWFATVLYLLIVEPPLYFPDIFGVEKAIGVVFVHNVFTVQFMYDRLPLYIVALYPAMAMLAYEVVRSLGVFRRRGIVLGSICVGFVHHCFYEVFDQLGPQLQWWAWNTGTAVNRPMLSSVPMSSVLQFATVGPALVTFFARAFVARRVEHGHHIGALGLVLRTLAIAVLMPISLVIVNIPVTLAAGHNPDNALRWALYAIYLAVFASLTLRELGSQWLAIRRGEVAGPDLPNSYVCLFGSVFLSVLGGLWLSALPNYLGGHGSASATGTPTGNLAYAAACFGLAAWMTWAVSIAPRRVSQTPESDGNRLARNANEEVSNDRP